MRRTKRLGALFCAVCALATAIVPAAYAGAGGGPGSNNGCPGNQAPPPPSGGCHH